MKSSELLVFADQPASEVNGEQRRLEALYRFGILDSLPEPQFNRLVALAAQFFDMPMASVTFVDERRQWFKAQIGLGCSESPRAVSFCSLAIAQEGVMVIPDATQDARLRTFANVTGDPHLRFYAGAPLITPDGHKLGTFCVLDQRPREFSPEQAASLESFAAMAMDELNLRRAVQDLGTVALHDALTGLPNRTHFRQLLAQACRRADHSGEKVVVGLIDLNRFKSINDTLGHAAGDTLLQQVALRLRHSVATSDVVARMSGDEFTLLLTDVRSVGDVEKVMTSLRVAFEQPFELSGQQVSVQCSIGLSCYPDQTRKPEFLLNQADAAMYRVKRAGGNHAFFDETLDQRPAVEVEQLTALRHATERDEFQLTFGAIVDAGSRRTVAHEALLRWERPGGAVSPVDFIPLAEASGLIVPIGRWVLRKAAEAVGRGQINCVSVNVSALELQQPDFVSSIQAVLEQTRIQPGQLWLELSESCLLEPERHRAVIEQLNVLGIGTALGNFGTGRSNLMALTQLPTRILKVARGFSAGVGDASLPGRQALEVMRGVVTIARAYGLTLVAEGVETEQQARALSEIGCTYLQGSLFDDPAPLPVGPSRTSPAVPVP